MTRVNSNTKKDIPNAVLTGVLFITATVSAIIGLRLYDPILKNPDFLIQGAENSNQIIWGALFELILACSVVGTAITLYPYLKKYNKSLGLGYVIFRILEVVFILVGILSVLALLKLSQEFTTEASTNIQNFQSLGKILIAIHDFCFILGPNFMLGINTFIYSYIFYRSELAPRKIAALGIIGSILIFTAALLELFGIILQISTFGILLALPIAIYEMILAAWLIINGFNVKA